MLKWIKLKEVCFYCLHFHHILMKHVSVHHHLFCECQRVTVSSNPMRMMLDAQIHFMAVLYRKLIVLFKFDISCCKCVWLPNVFESTIVHMVEVSVCLQLHISILWFNMSVMRWIHHNDNQIWHSQQLNKCGNHIFYYHTCKFHLSPCCSHLNSRGNKPEK